MMASEYIIDVSEADFEYQVLNYSSRIPVIVDFWAEWCIPCHTLGPILEQLAEEGKGNFRLAKVDVDQNPNLAMRYNIRSIPTVKAFRDGTVISEFFGLQPEHQIREFIHALAPSPTDLALEKAQSLMSLEQWKSAENSFRQVLSEKPGYPVALLGLAKTLILQGKVKEGRELLIDFPASTEYSAAETTRVLADALLRIRNGDPLYMDPMDAAYNRSLDLVIHGNIPAALDGLLDIIRQDKHYLDGEAHKVILSIFELLGDKSSVTRQYRQELASVLF